MAPRVVFATTVFDDVRTGPAIYAHYLWRAFRDDAGLDFHVVAPRCGERHPKCHEVGCGRRRSCVYGRVARRTRELAAGGQKAAIVHVNAAHAAAGLVGYPGPWIVQVNDYEVAALAGRAFRTLLSHGPRRLLSLAWRRRQEGKVIPAASRVVCNSHFTREMVLRHYPCDERKVVTIHKAVDTAAFARPEKLPADPLPSRPAGARLAFVGSNWLVKGLDVLFEALAAVAREVPQVTLAVAGAAEGGTNARVRGACGRYGVRDRVRFAGALSRAELAALLWHSDVLVLPSRQEAFGVAVLEGMAAGLPVVATAVGGIVEIIRGDADGLLCPPGDRAALAAAIVRVLTDAQLRRRLARSGPPRAEKFAVGAMTQAVRRLYVELAAEAGP